LALNRRSFIKVAGAAAGALLVSFGLQNATMRNIKAERVPGAGHPEVEDDKQEDKDYTTRVDAIDTKKFLAGCSRCGVCLTKCPFGAIKSESIAIPQLTAVSARKCPGYENCGVCATVCPTDCLNDAFSDFDKDPIVGEKPGWWEGPYEVRERKPGI
jgi:heterodisulfide reductase subunit A-like polyferredoxin